MPAVLVTGHIVTQNSLFSLLAVVIAIWIKGSWKLIQIIHTVAVLSLLHSLDVSTIVSSGL